MKGEDGRLYRFLPLDRKIQQHWLNKVRRIYSEYEAWIDLLFMANFKQEMSTTMINGKSIATGYSQVAASLTFLSHRWLWGVHKVRRYLVKLEADGMITRQPLAGATSIITITNYPDYNTMGQADRNTERNSQQPDKQQGYRGEGQADGQADRKQYKTERQQEYKTFIDGMNEITGREANYVFKGDKTSQRQFNARREEGYTLDTILEAARNARATQYHQQNPQYLTPEFITRSAKLQQYNVPKEVTTGNYDPHK